MKKIPVVFSMLVATTLTFAGPNDSSWIQLFRAGDTALSDWTIKIQNQPVGVNAGGIFKYAVSMDTHEPRLEVINTSSFNGFGHMFYKTPFSNYILRGQFHFPTNQSFGGQSWTVQNNGFMLHAQSPDSMKLNQEFPNSIENQLVGYWGNAAGSPPNSRSSSVCLPGSEVDINGQYASDSNNRHCTYAKDHSLLYDSSVTSKPDANSSNTSWPGANIWQYAMAKVMDSSYMTFYVRNRPDTAWDSVMHITKIRVGGKSAACGYIAIQSEGTSTEFAKIELLNLVGCMTPSDANFKSYFVKNDPAQCGKPTLITSQRKWRNDITFSGNRILATHEILNIEVYTLSGERIAFFPGKRQKFMDLNNLRGGLYTLRVHTKNTIAESIFLKI